MPADQRTVAVTVSRDDEGWLAVCTEPVMVAVHDRRLERLETAVRTKLGDTARRMEFGWSYDLSADLLLALNDFHVAQGELAEAQLRYGRSLAAAVAECSTSGIPDRDAAHLLGLSHQRVAQVRAEARRSGRPADESPSD